MKKRKLLVIVVVGIILGIISIGLFIWFSSPGDVRIVSVTWDVSYGEYKPGEFTENDYTFDIEIKNIGRSGIDYTIHLYQYRVGEDPVHGHLDDANSIRGYLDSGDTTTVTLSTSVITEHLMFDASISVYSSGYTDDWIKRIKV